MFEGFPESSVVFVCSAKNDIDVSWLSLVFTMTSWEEHPKWSHLHVSSWVTRFAIGSRRFWSSPFRTSGPRGTPLGPIRWGDLWYYSVTYCEHFWVKFRIVYTVQQKLLKWSYKKLSMNVDINTHTHKVYTIHFGWCTTQANTSLA